MTLDGTNSAWLSIVGVGEDGIEGLSNAARALIGSAELVVGGERHLQLAASLIQGRTLVWSSPLDQSISEIKTHASRPVVVLASGDPFHFGIGVTLSRYFPAEDIFSFPNSSAFSLVANRLKWALQDTVTLGLNGRSIELIRPHLRNGARIIALTTDGVGPGEIAKLLCTSGFGESQFTVFDRLGGDAEAHWSGTADEVGTRQYSALNTVAIETRAEADARQIPRASGLPDDWFDNDGQLTKREVRAITLSSLAPAPGDLLWDIGCGSGSIAIEWMLAHPRCHAIGIEKNNERAARAARNAIALGVPGLRIETGSANAVLSDLQTPDAVFFGGGASERALIDAAWKALRSGGRLVANAVTLETEAVLQQAYSDLGGHLARISVERADKVGRFTGWRPARAVVQWVCVKP